MLRHWFFADYCETALFLFVYVREILEDGMQFDDGAFGARLTLV